MLRLEKIVIQGFKSFKKKASIPFPTGFSCITGPNGAGKTNVLDAFCFVLGKKSSRTMRAKISGDLVFHGSKQKSAADFANVMLYIDNTGGELPLEKGSVTIGRRINKKGVSTYRLNGRVVTRQQILDIFSKAGMHPDGHNIIQQGDVNRVVEMDAMERKGIIDEISGIAEYDDKKNKAMKELAKIAEKVKEAEIVLNEKQSVMERLRNDRDIALKYQELQGKLEKIRTSLIWLEKNDSQNCLKDVNKKLKEKNKESEKLGKEIKEFDDKIDELERNQEKLAAKLRKGQEEIEAAKTIARVEGEIEIKRERIELNKREIERIEAMTERMSSFSNTLHPNLKVLMDRKGVFGAVSDLIKVPSQYKVAVEIAGGGRLKDIVVDTTETAVSCVKFLRKNRIGRARFLPLDKIKPYGSKFLPKEAIDWVGGLIKYEPKYRNVMDFIFGSTACVSDIDLAKTIGRTHKIRMVTLDGDMMEASGAVTGGYYKKGPGAGDSSKIFGDAKKNELENVKLRKEIERLMAELSRLQGIARPKKKHSVNAERDEARLDSNLRYLRDKRKEAYEKRLVLQSDIGRLSIDRAKMEAKFDNISSQFGDDLKIDPNEIKDYINLGAAVLRLRNKKTVTAIQELGLVNMKALQDFNNLMGEFEDFKEKVGRIIEEKDSIEKTIAEVEGKRTRVFTKAMDGVSANFKEIYKELTGGDAELALVDPKSLDSGMLINAQPPGKRLKSIDSLSGGEKSLTAFAFVFALQKHRPSPFYILDEADAALDKENTLRVVKLLKKQSKDVQFVIISHNDSLVKEADQIFGVSMERGESKVFGVKLPPN
ncbi:MAG: chromosome segregation SMC family protein [Candidatus Aenigmarchaeota archaeon]